MRSNSCYAELMRLNPPSAGFASLTVFLSASLWGLYWIPLRYLEDQGVGGGWAIVLMNLPAAIVLAVAVIWNREDHRGHVRQALAIGVLTGLGMALYGLGLVYSSVVRATLLFYLTPVWSTLIGMVWLGEKASWQRWAGIVGGLGGVWLLVSGSESIPLNIGDFYALLSGVFWAFGAAMIKRFDTVPVSGMTMVQFACAALGAIVLGAVASDVAVPDRDVLVQVMPTTVSISVAIFLPAVFVLFWAQKFLYPGRVGLLMMSEVLMAVATASIFLPNERMSALAWTGAALIIGACLVEVLLSPDGHPEPARDTATSHIK